MRFYTEFKRPERADYYLEWFWGEEYIPWTPELRKLIHIHRLYRTWLEDGASESDRKFGLAPQYIVDELISITQIFASLESNITDIFYNRTQKEEDLREDVREEVNVARGRSVIKEGEIPSFIHLYPGLEDKDYHSYDTSVAVVSFDTDFDLEAVANNEAGFPLEKELIDKLIPRCKWISGTIDLPIDMTLEQIIEEEERSPLQYSNYWWYIARDVEIRVAGISLNVYMPNGTKAFYMDNSTFVLKNKDLQGKDLSKLNRLMSGLNLSNANLSGANLCGTNLKRSDLSGANLSNALYDNKTSWPEGFDYQNSGAIGPKANFQSVELNHVNLSGIDLQGADLQGVHFEGVNLQSASLKETNLRGANLSTADLEGADLEDARYDETTSWPDGFNYQSSGAIGPKANLQKLNLCGLNLEHVNLNEAYLHGAGLIGTHLKGSSLIGADLSAADLTKANLENVDMTSADLRNAWFKNANLCGTILSGANIKKAVFQGAQYNSNTKWPEGFDPQDAGAVLEDEQQ